MVILILQKFEGYPILYLLPPPSQLNLISQQLDLFSLNYYKLKLCTPCKNRQDIPLMDKCLMFHRLQHLSLLVQYYHTPPTATRNIIMSSRNEKIHSITFTLLLFGQSCCWGMWIGVPDTFQSSRLVDNGESS